MRVDPLFDGWWIVETPGWPHRDANGCYRTSVRQIRTGERYNVEHARGPFPTREDAEGFQYCDQLAGYWEHGLPVYADHCLGCGRFAKVLAFDDAGGGWNWRVTECKRCGVIDSRTDYQQEAS